MAPAVLREPSAVVGSREALVGQVLGRSARVREGAAALGLCPELLLLLQEARTRPSGSRTRREPEVRRAAARRLTAAAGALLFPASPAMQTRWSGRTVARAGRLARRAGSLLRPLGRLLLDVAARAGEAAVAAALSQSREPLAALALPELTAMMVS